MKAYTDLEQSKTLAEILPTESADMYYHPYPNDEDWYDIPNFGEADLKFNQLPCWSIAALLDVIRKCCERFELTLRADKRYNIFGTASNDFVYHSFDEHPEGIDNLIDACYEMILKLHEEKLL